MQNYRYPPFKMALGVLAFLLLSLSSACDTLSSPDSRPAAVKQERSGNFDWLQFNGNPQHTGSNTSERTLTPANVASLKKLFQVLLPGIADGSPVYVSNISTRQGQKNVLFLSTTNGSVLAVDAHTGDFIWQRDYPPHGCKVNNGSQDCYTTSSPAVDPNRQFVYTYGLDGKVHKLKVGDGTEITSAGWPETVTLKPYDEKGSSALAVATAKDGSSYLYVAMSGYLGDQGDYQGHITTINLSTGSQRIFNTMCSNQEVHFAEKPEVPDCPGVRSAIWARPGVIYDPATDRIYAATGNGDFAPSNFEWGDSVIALHPDGTGTNGGPLDSYTPANYQQLSDQDLDLGSTAPAILPVPANSKIKNLAIQCGKDGMLRLLNLDNLSGKGSPGNTGGEISSPIPVPQGGGVLTQPAVWTNPQDQSTWIFVASGSGISALKLVVDAQGNPSLSREWVSPDGGTSPIVADSVLYVAATGAIRALDPLTGALLWKNNSVGRIHWSSPIVANGVLYITDQSEQLTAFTLDNP